MTDETMPTIPPIETESETQPDISSAAGMADIFESALLTARSQDTIYAPSDETSIDLGDFE